MKNELLQYTDEIEALIQKAQLPSEDKHGLVIYIHDESLSRKVSSIYPDVEECSGELWCVTTCFCAVRIAPMSVCI